MCPHVQGHKTVRAWVLCSGAHPPLVVRTSGAQGSRATVHRDGVGQKSGRRERRRRNGPDPGGVGGKWLEWERRKIDKPAPQRVSAKLYTNEVWPMEFWPSCCRSRARLRRIPTLDARLSQVGQPGRGGSA